MAINLADPHAAAAAAVVATFILCALCLLLIPLAEWRERRALQRQRAARRLRYVSRFGR